MKMLVIGLIDIFRSSFLVLPLLYLVMELSIIIRGITKDKTITMKSFSQIIKSLLLLLFGSFFLQLISFLPGVGLSSAGIGIIALFISSSNSMLKTMSPLIAPNISKLSILLNEIDFLDSQFMKTIQTNRETEQNQSVEEEEAEEEE
jgi:hypothetical protein